MKIKTRELIDAPLDVAVAIALGRGPKYNMESHGLIWRGWWLTQGGEYERMPYYSTEWAHGGLVMEQKGITVAPFYKDWVAADNVGELIQDRDGDKLTIAMWDSEPHSFGPTPLIAAMRCFVTSKLGEEVDVPEELT